MVKLHSLTAGKSRESCITDLRAFARLLVQLIQSAILPNGIEVSLHIASQCAGTALIDVGHFGKFSCRQIHGEQGGHTHFKAYRIHCLCGVVVGHILVFQLRIGVVCRIITYFLCHSRNDIVGIKA